jgi:hypothetical protein
MNDARGGNYQIVLTSVKTSSSRKTSRKAHCNNGGATDAATTAIRTIIAYVSAFSAPSANQVCATTMQI